MSYRVFVRNWWRIENGKRVPHPGAPEHTIAEDVETEDEARQLAKEYNKNHDPGELSRKAEFTEE